MIQWCWPDSAGIGAGNDAERQWQSDRGLAYADGLFETIRVGPNGPVLLEQHRERLLKGCRTLGLNFSDRDWKHWLAALADRGWFSLNALDGHVLKIIVTRGSGGRGYCPPVSSELRVISSRAPMPALPESPVQLQLCRTALTTNPNGGLKTLNRLDQVMAARELSRTCFEGLMLDSLGRPVEGTRSNLFVFSKGIVVTPPDWQLAVAGVMRRVLIEVLPTLGIGIREQPLGFRQLRESQGAFLASSVMGIIPIASIGCLKLRYPKRIQDIQSFTRQHYGI